MPYATTHILIAIILIELFREYVIKNNKKFPRYYILVAAIGAVIPDIDILAFYFLNFFGFTYEEVHRTFMHTLFIPLISLIIGMIFLTYKISNKQLRDRHLKLSTIFFILSAGCLLHLVLDATFYGMIKPFYPLLNFEVGLNLILLFSESIRNLVLPTLDGILLLFWLFWLEFKLKIGDYF